jgi:hypothetical protein
LEVSLIRELIQKKHAITITGGRGVGKTDLVKSFIEKYVKEDTTQVWYTAPVLRANKLLFDDFLYTFLASHEKDKIRKYIRNNAFPDLESSIKSKTQYLYDILKYQKTIVVIDDSKQEHLFMFQELIRKLQEAVFFNSKIIFVGRNVKLSGGRKANISVGGFSKTQLLDYYGQYLKIRRLSKEEVSYIWDLTYGIPLLNSHLRDGLNRSSRNQFGNLIGYDISQFDEIQDYLYSTFSKLNNAERKLLKILSENQGRMKCGKFNVYALLLCAAKEKKILSGLIERSAIYKDETHYFIPKIANNYLSLQR